MKQSIYLLLFLIFVTSCSKEVEYITNKGFVFGTTYTFTYKSDKDLSADMLARLKQYDASLSPFNKESIISKINRNEDVEVDTFFARVYNKAYEMYLLSGGAFDITVKPLSKLWRFDGEKHDTITMAQYEQLVRVARDSLSSFIGMDKVKLENYRVVKEDERIELNANALAEGCGIDLAADLLDERGVTDYMVEIGGEMRLKGKNPKGERWRIGIDSPMGESVLSNRQLYKIVSLTDCAVSTSGGYRQYIWREDSVKLSHIIDPRTGVPVESDILSVTVIGPNTMTTDALATTFTVVGIEKTKEILSKMKGIEVYIIYRDGENSVSEMKLGTYSDNITWH